MVVTEFIVAVYLETIKNGIYVYMQNIKVIYSHLMMCRYVTKVSTYPVQVLFSIVRRWLSMMFQMKPNLMYI